MSSRIPLGKTRRIIKETLTESTTLSRSFVIESDTVILSLSVGSVDTSLDVTVYTYAEDITQKTVVVEFPQVTAATSEIILKKAASALDNIIVEVVSVGGADFEVHAKALSAGELSARFIGATDGDINRTTVTTSAKLLISAALSDRAGFIIQHNGESGILYIGFSEADVTTNIATKTYPIKGGGNVAMDLGSGKAIWVIGSEDIDVSIIEGGG